MNAGDYVEQVVTKAGEVYLSKGVPTCESQPSNPGQGSLTSASVDTVFTGTGHWTGYADLGTLLTPLMFGGFVAMFAAAQLVEAFGWPSGGGAPYGALPATLIGVLLLLPWLCFYTNRWLASVWLGVQAGLTTLAVLLLNIRLDGSFLRMSPPWLIALFLLPWLAGAIAGMVLLPVPSILGRLKADHAGRRHSVVIDQADAEGEE